MKKNFARIKFGEDIDSSERITLDTSKISGSKRSDYFTCTSANVIYRITCTLCNKLYIGETGRLLSDRFCEHLRDVEKNDKDASKPVARLSQHQGTTESRKNLAQKIHLPNRHP